MTEQASGNGQGAGPQQDAGQQNPQGAGEAQGANGGEGQGAGTQALTPEQMAQELARARQEAARYRNERNSFREKVTEYEQASLTETQRLQQELQAERERASALQSAAQEARLEATVTATATTLGFRNPALALGLLKRDAVEFDANGRPQNVDALLAEIARNEPYLLKGQGSGNGGEGQGDHGAPTGMNDLIRRGAGRA